MMLNSKVHYLTVTTFFILQTVLLVDGHGLCAGNLHVDLGSNKNYKSFMHLDTIGVSQCINVCKRYRVCEKIHHNREKLTCELMMTYGEEGSMTSLLDVESIHIDSSSNCLPGSCSETEVCVDMRDGSSTCLDLDLCPTTDWKHFSHKCYLFSGTYTTEQQNVVFCNSLNATLVRVDNAEVNSFLVSEITTRGIPDMWLAANDKVVEGEWVWGPGDVVLTTMWGPGEPNPHDNSEDCAGLRRVTGLWADYSCTKNVHVVCEVPYGLFP